MTERITVTTTDYGWVEMPGYEALVGTFGEIIAHTDWGSYQGDSLYLIKRPAGVGVLSFGWGSCSGCDALEACSTQKDLDSLQDDLERGIREFPDSVAALEWIDADGLKDSWLDAEMILAFRKAIITAPAILGVPALESSVASPVEPK